MSWTARIIIAIDALRSCLIAGTLLLGLPAIADVRDHTRLKGSPAAVSQTQAGELSLATSEVAPRPIQVLVRLRGTREGTGARLRAVAMPVDAKLLRTGQRVRVFSTESRSSMLQARVERIASGSTQTEVQVALAATPPPGAPANFLMEIVVDMGQFLSVPNDAVIEEGTHRVVYVRKSEGEYEARRVEVGIQGELFTAITSGLKAGEQVVTTGSFFIDADQKMKGGD